MDLLIQLYLMNLLVTAGLFIATLYRIKLEHKMAKLTEENTRHRKVLKKVLYLLDNERDIVDECSGKEVRKALREIIEKELSEI